VIAALALSVIASTAAVAGPADSQCGAGACGKKSSKSADKEASCSKKDASTTLPVQAGSKEASCSKKDAACSKKDKATAKEASCSKKEAGCSKKDASCSKK